MGHMFLNAATACLVALAVLMTQAIFHQTATATPPKESRDFVSLMQRVADLEDRLDASDNEFVLIDGSLGDLDLRVNANEATGRANSADVRKLRSQVRAVSGRVAKMEARR